MTDTFHFNHHLFTIILEHSLFVMTSLDLSCLIVIYRYLFVPASGALLISNRPHFLIQLQSMENKLKTISFQPRESSLTSLINTNQDVRSFMNLISAFVYRLSTIIPVQYYIDRQVFYSDVNFILWCFSSFYIFIIYDILLHFMVISIFYPVAKIFRSNRE